MDSDAGEAGVPSLAGGEEDSLEQGHQSPSFPAEAVSLEALSCSFVQGRWREPAERSVRACVYACRSAGGMHLPVRLSVGRKQL